MIVEAIELDPFRRTPPFEPKPEPPTPANQPSAPPLPGLLVSRNWLEAASTGLVQPTPAADDALLAISPDLVSGWLTPDLQSGLQDLVGIGAGQVSPVAGQACDLAWMVIGEDNLLRRWQDPGRADPVTLVLDTVRLAAIAGMIGSNYVGFLAPYKPHLQWLGLGCAVVGEIYKGWAKPNTAGEQEMLDSVQQTVIQHLAPSPVALSMVLANVVKQLPS